MPSPRPSAPASDGIMAMLYHWGARLIGSLLLVYLLMRLVRQSAGGADPFWNRAIELGSHVSLVGLWAVPVLALLIGGSVWIRRNRRDWTGWFAVAISLFLSSFWVVK